MCGLGIHTDQHVVVYDRSDAGILTSARVWWMFRAMGHDKGLESLTRPSIMMLSDSLLLAVSVLDGGFPRWLLEQLPVESGPPPPHRVHTSHAQ